MNIEQIKTKLGIASLDLARGNKPDGSPNQWLRYWDNDRRVSLVAHEDVINNIKKDKAGCNNLAVKTTQEVAVESSLPYTQHMLVQATSIEVTL